MNDESIKKAVFILIIAIDAFVPLIIWTKSTDYFYYPKITVIYFIVLAITFLTLYIFLKGNISLNLSWELFFLSLYAAMILLSAWFSKYRSQSFWGRPLRCEGAFAYISYFLILYFSYLYVKNNSGYKKVIAFIIISSCIISLYAILQYIGIDPIKRDSIRKEWVYNSFSTLGNRDFLGSYLSIVIPVTIICCIWNKKTLQSVLLFFAALVQFSALICSMARSAWLGIMLSLIFLFIVFFKESIRKYKKILALLLIFILVAFSINMIHKGSVSSRFKKIASDFASLISKPSINSTAGSQRIFIWLRTMDYIFERPILGSGPDTFDKVFSMSPKEAKYHFGSQNIYVDKAHNEYLQIIVTTGFPSLFFYMVFLSIVYRKALKSLKYGNKNIYTLCFLGGVTAYIIQAFFNISVVSVAPLYWSLLGMLISSYGDS